MRQMDSRSADPLASVDAVIARSPVPPDGSSPAALTSALDGAGPAGARRFATLRAALVSSGAGALLTGLASTFPAVSPPASPAFTSWPLLLVLAALAPLIATVFAARGRPVVAAAVLLAPAALVPGRVLSDLQLVMDAGLAARPEYLVPHTVAPLAPSTGLWLLLAGHAATGLAGVLAVLSGPAGPERGFAERSDVDGVGGGASPAMSGQAGTGGSTGDLGSLIARRQGLLAAVLCAGVVAGVGVLMAPFASDDPYLIPRAAIDSPPWVLAGSVLLALAIPFMAAIVVSSGDPDTAGGGLLGLAAAVTAVEVPPLAASALVDNLHATWGPLVSLLAAVAFVVLALRAGRALTSTDEPRELSLPAFSRLLTAAAALAVAGGVLAIAGAMTPQLTMPAGISAPPSYSARMLLPAGLVLVVLGAGLLVPKLAAAIRPAVTVAWVAVPLTAAGALDTVLTATQAAGAQAAVGAWAAGMAVVFAALAGGCAALAGGVERDDVDLTELGVLRALVGPALLAVLLAVGAFALPVLTAPDYTPPGVFGDFRTTSWGLLLALLAVAGAAALSPLCRGPRAAALAVGAALVVAVRVVELPLTAGRAAGSGPGLGLWFGLACIAVLLVTAAVAARAGMRGQ